MTWSNASNGDPTPVSIEVKPLIDDERITNDALMVSNPGDRSLHLTFDKFDPNYLLGQICVLNGGGLLVIRRSQYAMQVSINPSRSTNFAG